MDPFLTIPLPTLLSFALASFIIEVTPGPNMTYLALVSASEGRRAGFATVAGISLGLAIIGLAAAFGVAQLVSASPFLYEALRWGGIVFLLYLAWDGWRGEESTAIEAGDRKFFTRGLVTNLLNPKAAVFYIAVLPNFVDAARPLLAQTVTLTLVYVAVATLIHVGIVVLAGAATPFLTDPRRERMARRTLSALLALVALWFGWATAR
jgi:threonine/homoserine/homoserine lactone efflux protein